MMRRRYDASLDPFHQTRRRDDASNIQYPAITYVHVLLQMIPLFCKTIKNVLPKPAGPIRDLPNSAGAKVGYIGEQVFVFFS